MTLIPIREMRANHPDKVGTNLWSFTSTERRLLVYRDIHKATDSLPKERELRTQFYLDTWYAVEAGLTVDLADNLTTMAAVLVVWLEELRREAGTIPASRSR